MSPEDTAAVCEAWTELAPNNRYAKTFLALVSGTENVDDVPSIVTGITRSLPGQWADLAEVIVATGRALEARQALTDETFADLVQTMASGPDVLDLLRDGDPDDVTPGGSP